MLRWGNKCEDYACMLRVVCRCTGGEYVVGGGAETNEGGWSFVNRCSENWRCQKSGHAIASKATEDFYLPFVLQETLFNL